MADFAMSSNKISNKKETSGSKDLSGSETLQRSLMQCFWKLILNNFNYTA